MKESIKRKKMIVLTVICALFVSMLPFYEKAEAEAASKPAIKTFHVNAYMKSPVQVKIGWKKQDVDKFVIYRADAKADGTITGKYKRIGDASGKKRSFIDRFASLELLEAIWNEEIEWEGRYYAYQVYGYKKIDGKYTRVCKGERMVYTGEWNTMWDEYQRPDAKVTPESIPLRVWAGREFKPDYYRIYRSEDDKNYKMITEIKSREYGIEYVDTDVETGKTYYYKARTYRMVGKEKVFSDYTVPMKHSAVNRVGVYTYEVLTPANEKTSELIMKLGSDEKNGNLIFDAGLGWNSLYYYTDYDYEGEAMDISMDIVAYSYDNENWTDFIVRDEQLVIKAGESIYLKFATRDGVEFIYLDANDNVTTMGYEEVRYNDFYCSLQFGQGGGAEAKIIGEYYH